MADPRPLRNGMVMTPAHISSVRPHRDFLRVTLEAPSFAELEVRGRAPVFKIFVPRTGQPLDLPTFDEHNLADPDWESSDARPLARAYTALDFSLSDTSLTFDALDLGHPDWWLRRVDEGDPVGFIGFKNPVVLSDDIVDVVAVGDASAAPALRELAMLGSGAVTVRRQQFESVILTGFDPHTTLVWIGGEVSDVRAIHEEAIRYGIPPDRVLAHAYWARGLTRDEFDHDLYQRYQRAAAMGLDISDHVVAARIELDYPR